MWTNISAKDRHYRQRTRVIIYQSGNTSTMIDIIRSAGFNARIEFDCLNVYKTNASYIHVDKCIWTVFGVRKALRKKCMIFCDCLTKTECRLHSEVDTTLEIAQNGMLRVVLL